MPLTALKSHFDASGEVLWRYANGINHRKVEPPPYQYRLPGKHTDVLKWYNTPSYVKGGGCFVGMVHN